MPRRTRPPARRGRKADDAGGFDPRKLSETLAGPGWARVEGFRVLQSVNRDKGYRCPYCEGWINPGTPHLVVIPEGRMEERRHYHTPCWARQEGLRRPSAG